MKTEFERPTIEERTGYIRPLNIIEYIVEEVTRQGFTTSGSEFKTDTMEGIQQVAWMTNAWAFAMKRSSHADNPHPSITDVIKLGRLVESVKNRNGIRKDFVYVLDSVTGEKKSTAHPDNIGQMLTELLRNQWLDHMPPLHFYKQFCKIHPFMDGNGRVGKILLNWVNGSLWEPVFPPKDLWGKVIRNP